MISCLVIRFFAGWDPETDMRLSLENVLGIALLELFMFGIQMALLGEQSVSFTLLTVFGTVYMCSTAVIDHLTGYVYCISHFIMLLLIILFGITEGGISFQYCFWTVFYLLFLMLCEHAGAFSRGDSEYLAVSYIYFGCGAIGGYVLEYMLAVMLMSALVFGIFRKDRAGKEGSAFTPVIVFSEYIIMICFRLLT